MRLFFFVISLLVLPAVSLADVVKPTMVDIAVRSEGRVLVELHVSIEALLTGINNRYKNTKDAPNSDEYDVLRALQGPELAERFAVFQSKMLEQMELRFDGQRSELQIVELEIPEPGYKKYPVPA